MISDVAFFSERGVREVNQDAICVSAGKNRGIFVVADGMGGHAGGEIASGAIINGIRGWWDNGSFEETAAEIDGVAKQCSDLLLNINAEIYCHFVERGQMGGSTVAVLIIWDDRYLILSAGDSRIYRVKEKVLEQLTTDDVWENLPDVKYEMSNERVVSDSRFGKLTEAVGSEERLRISRKCGVLSEREVFFLCSDGVYKYCTHEKLERILCRGIGGKSAGRMTELIRKCTLKGGADDNYSAVVCKVKRR